MIEDMGLENCVHISFALKRFYDRCDAARHAGGISEVDYMRGAIVDLNNYWFDCVTHYYVPNCVRLLPCR